MLSKIEKPMSAFRDIEYKKLAAQRQEAQRVSDLVSFEPLIPDLVDVVMSFTTRLPYLDRHIEELHLFFTCAVYEQPFVCLLSEKSDAWMRRLVDLQAGMGPIYYIDEDTDDIIDTYRLRLYEKRYREDPEFREQENWS